MTARPTASMESTYFRVYLLTAADISACHVARSTVEVIRSLSQGSTEVFDSRSPEEAWLSTLDLDAEVIDSVYASGGLLGRALDEAIQFRIRWRRFRSEREFSQYVRRNGYIQNSLFLEVGMSVFDDPFAERLLTAVKRFCQLMRANLLYGFAQSGSLYNVSYDFELGAGVGLRDIYPINFFGRSYVDLVGKYRLEELPADVVSEVGDGLLVLPCRDYWRADPDRLLDKRRAIKDEIGSEYFSTGGERKGGVEVGWIGGLVTALWRERRRFSDESVLAEKRPEFDWSELIQGQKATDGSR